MKRTPQTSPTATTIGTSIRLRRTQAGLSVREAARRAGLSAAYLSEIENGHRTPRQEKYAQLAAAIPGLSLTTLEMANLAHQHPGRSAAWYRAVLATMRQKDDDVLTEIEGICGIDVAEEVKRPSEAEEVSLFSELVENIRQVLGTNQMSLEAITGSLLSLGMVNGSGETFNATIKVLLKKPEFVRVEKDLYRVRDRDR